MRSELRSLLSQVFRVPKEELDDRASPDTISAWDSLGHLQLIAALEATFAVRFNIREIQTMDSAARIEAVLQARGQ